MQECHLPISDTSHPNMKSGSSPWSIDPHCFWVYFFFGRRNAPTPVVQGSWEVRWFNPRTVEGVTGVSRLPVAGIRPYSSSVSSGLETRRSPQLSGPNSLVDVVVEPVGEPREGPSTSQCQRFSQRWSRERAQRPPTTTELRELRDLPSPALHFLVPLDRASTAVRPQLTATPATRANRSSRCLSTCEGEQGKHWQLPQCWHFQPQVPCNASCSDQKTTETITRDEHSRERDGIKTKGNDTN